MSEEKRTLTAEHDTISVFQGLKTLPCRFRTALCPDKCGHSKESALFEVKSYNNEVADHDTRVGFASADIDAASLDVIKGLKEGDEVHLVWKHEKVERPGYSGGERTLTKVAPSGGASAASAEKRTLIAEHDTISEFEGIKTTPCRFRTALCPDKCGHAKEGALFSIKSYNNKVDNEETKVGFEVADIDAESLAVLKGLKEGDSVHLVWKHEKVETPTFSGGERTITKVAKK
ncbi:hypothetical protein DFJ74DRAFT_711640 [Hyaloraphidium curvatum]|nr:hypothetical protein DFJ74DRAFT_711640 [Hyaloraphidium curvatum]